VGRFMSSSGSVGELWSVLAAWNSSFSASDQVCILGVTLLLDLSPNKLFAASVQHAPAGFTSSDRYLLDADSAATIVRIFVTWHLDYCSTIVTGVPKSITDMLR